MENLSAVQEKLSSFFMSRNTIVLTPNSVRTLLIAITAGCFIGSLIFRRRRNLPPAIRGALPFLGNILQLRQSRPHYLFTQWAEKYGPIFRLKAGMRNMVVCTSPELFKEVTVTKFNLISQRQLMTSFGTLSKGFVAMMDYGPKYSLQKRHYVTHLLGIHPQRANRYIREEEITKMVDLMLKDVAPEGKVLNMRDTVRNALFDFSLRQTFGFTFDSIHVAGLSSPDVSKVQVRHYLITNAILTGITIDWREFWPILSWIPNHSFEKRLQATVKAKDLIIKELIRMNKKHVSLNGPTGSYCEAVLQDKMFSTEEEIMGAIYEPMVESSDTSSLTTEWILFELAKKPEIQERLYNEIKSVVGDRMMNDDDIPNLPLLEAIIKETFRKHPPLPVMPSRLVQEDITIGGYDIPKGWEIMLNVWGMGMDKNTWSNPEVWDPDHCLNDSSLDLGIQNFKIAPFGGGKRFCSGMGQAMTVISLIICALVQHFQFALGPSELVDIAVEDEGLTTVTTYKATPLQAFAKPRVSKLLPKKSA